MRCLEKIALTKYSDTYCQLERGHEGEHAIVNRKLFRCSAVHEGKQCEQPIDHFGSHSWGGVVKVVW
jgi:hypothetical protein